MNKHNKITENNTRRGKGEQESCYHDPVAGERMVPKETEG